MCFNKDEYDEIPLVLHPQKIELKLTYEIIIGFYIGMNIGKDARQTRILNFILYLLKIL